MVRNFLYRNDGANVRCSFLYQSLEENPIEEFLTIGGVANGAINESDSAVEGI